MTMENQQAKKDPAEAGPTQLGLVLGAVLAFGEEQCQKAMV